MKLKHTQRIKRFLIKLKQYKLSHKQKKALFFIGVGYIVICCSYFTIKYLIKYYHHELLLNATTSLPNTLFWVDTSIVTGFNKGDYIVFFSPTYNNEIHKFTKIVKLVKGTVGDEVSTHDKQVYLNSKPIGVLFTKTHTGIKLEPTADQIIPAKCYFAWTPALRSYDSRYKDIGLICEKNHVILGKATPIF